MLFDGVLYIFFQVSLDILDLPNYMNIMYV